ncbi:hypothetical protein OC846_005994 [Tilletia horrida]|uniref:Histone chaperone domain-containing protein n=1 Tax=Tilletia horrida TaxID=155126 RepID=A0AAN6GJP4_9BASI|nr:hypothetical protein OC845_006113 [Tilletia horrida]KAK0544639.1 hypothetical protein OC846_005994 [Tilletia horrida]KAK0560877.1 hypothetical protein OC861_006088 [Tilletia horrida]
MADENKATAPVQNETGIAAASTTETTAAQPAVSEGKGKGKAVEPVVEDDDDDDDDDEEDDEDEDDDDPDEVIEDFDGEGALDPSNILPSRPRRAAAAKVTDYSSEEAIRKAGIPAEEGGSKEEDEDQDASYMDTGDDN